MGSFTSDPERTASYTTLLSENAGYGTGVQNASVCVFKRNKIRAKNKHRYLLMHKISLQGYTKIINSIVVQETGIATYAFLNCDSYVYKE